MGEYVLICPVCRWETESTYRSMLSSLKANLAEHVMSDKAHRDIVAEWFRNNRKNWGYVRREVIRTLSSRSPVAVTLTGVSYSFSREDLVERLKGTKDPGEFIEALCEACRKADERCSEKAQEAKSAEDAFQKEADRLSLMSLVYWIGTYWIERNMLTVSSRDDVPENTDKVVFVENRWKRK